MNVLIRPMQCEDLPAVHAIELTSYTNHWSFLAMESEWANQPFHHAFVAVERQVGTLLGYCFFWYVHQDDVSLTNIAIHALFRRQGIGKMLLNAVIAFARAEHAPAVILEVRESNVAALRFYHRHGFEVVGRRARYYQRPIEDALLMRLDLHLADAGPFPAEDHAS